MEPANPNPYAPPEMPFEPIVVRKPRRAWGLLFSIAVFSLFYIVFTCLLLTSNDIDRKAGRMFLLNIPVLVGMLACMTQSKRLGACLGLAFICVQVAIVIALLWIITAAWFWVIFINFVFIAPVVAITTIAWVSKPIPKRE